MAKKKATKKKAAKKKAGKKKVSKKVAAEPGVKKATRKKASKKAGKKKRAKKKTASAASSSDSLSRLMAAVEELRDAVVDFAQAKTEDQQVAVAELRRSAQAKIADLEESAVRALKKLGL
jgi:hypothetical protein